VVDPFVRFLSRKNKIVYYTKHFGIKNVFKDL